MQSLCYLLCLHGQKSALGSYCGVGGSYVGVEEKEDWQNGKGRRNIEEVMGNVHTYI